MGEFNLARVVGTVAAELPDRAAVVWGDRRLTFADLCGRTDRLASYLAGRGLGARQERAALAGHESGQDHLGIYLYNGNEYLEAMLGSYRARVAPFNVNYRYVAEELRYLLDNARTRALVYHASFAPTLARILPDVGDVEVLLQVPDESGHALLEGAVDYEAALASAPAHAPAAEPSPDDLYILYTGGTTGMPKGVLWRQHDIFVAAMGGRAMGTWEEVATYEVIAERARNGFELRMMILPPLMHGAAQWAAFMGLTAGATVLFPDDTRRLDPAAVWRAVESHKAQVVTIVGDAMARPLVEELERNSYDLSQLVSLGSGGAAMNPALKERLLAKAPHMIVADAVGSSETGAQMAHTSTPGAVATGRFTPGPQTVVVSDDSSRLLAPGEEEEGWLAQAGHIPLGYLGDAPKTEATFPVIDGVRYAMPGDRARLLENGDIELLGRDSVTINSGGEKIFAEEVERAIAQHPAVADVVVAGRPSERWGQEVVALVVLGEGRSASAEDIVEHAAGHVARYKLPKAVAFLDDLHRSPAGKADYRWARQQAVQLGSD